MGISMAESIHCKECGALVYKDETFRGLGFRCGCISRYIREIEKQLKDLEKQSTSLR